jgi:hypothetical protein
MYLETKNDVVSDNLLITIDLLRNLLILKIL